MWSFLWYNMIIKIQPGRRLTYNNDFLENLSSFKIAVYVFIHINNGDEDFMRQWCIVMLQMLMSYTEINEEAGSRNALWF